DSNPNNVLGSITINDATQLTMNDFITAAGDINALGLDSFVFLSGAAADSRGIISTGGGDVSFDVDIEGEPYFVIDTDGDILLSTIGASVGGNPNGVRLEGDVITV